MKKNYSTKTALSAIAEFNVAIEKLYLSGIRSIPQMEISLEALGFKDRYLTNRIEESLKGLDERWQEEWSRPKGYHGGKLSKNLDYMAEWINTNILKLQSRIMEVEANQEQSKMKDQQLSNLREQVKDLIKLGLSTSQTIIKLHGFGSVKEEPKPKTDEDEQPLLDPSIKAMAVAASTKPKPTVKGAN